MARCRKGGGCNTPYLLARRKAEAKAIHDKFMRQHIAKQKIRSITPKAFKRNPRAFWIVSGVSALGILAFVMFRKRG